MRQKPSQHLIVCRSSDPTVITGLDGRDTPYAGSYESSVDLTYLHKNGMVVRTLGGDWTFGQLHDLASAMGAAEEEGYRRGVAARSDTPHEVP